MDKALKDRLVSLADRYERAAFMEGDPSCFMHRYARTEDQELAAFVAAALAFGRREQILSHVEAVLSLAGDRPADWVTSGGWEAYFPDSPSSFYRTYSHAAMRALFRPLQGILRQMSLGDYFKERWRAERDPAGGQEEAACGQGGATCGQGAAACRQGEAACGQGEVACRQGRASRPRQLCQVIARCFPPDCTLIPRSEDCAFKKLNMFLRWMVRDSSPVDLGLWSSWYGKADLLIPLDTHVMQEATRLGLLAPSSSGRPKAATLKCARELTARLAEAFPGDPVRGDYALFGLGVDG